MGCFAPDAPKSVNYGQQTRDTLQAQVDLAPQQFLAESNPAYGQPAYTSLALQNLNTLLHGTPGGTQTVNFSNPVSHAGYYDASGNYLGNDRYMYYTPGTPGTTTARAGVSNLFGLQTNGVTGNGKGQPGTWNIPQGVRWLGKGGTISGTRDITTEATPGLMQMLQEQASSQRAGDIADVQSMGLAAHDAMLAANPESAALLAKLNTQANEGLDAGSNLTPDEQRAMQQASRAAFAARGMGGGNGAVSDELLRQFDLGQQLLRQRQQFAQGLIGTYQGVVGDPFQQILGRNSGAVPLAQQAGSQSGPSLFNPESSLSGQIAAGNQAYQAMFADPSTMSKVGAVSNTLGSFIGSIGSAMI